MFVDTWAWVAWAATDDVAHTRVAALRRELQQQAALLVTSNFVLAESLTRLRYDAGLANALVLIEVVEALADVGAVEVVVVDEALWTAALGWFGRYDDQRFSMVDCTSFAIMQTRGLTEALTGDRHFATAGFTPLGA